MFGRTLIHIRSPKLPMLPGEEDELINEGMCGKALALYLQEKLPGAGYAVPRIVAEDWGWWVGADDGAGFLDLCVNGLPPEEEESPELAVCVGNKKGRRWSWSRFRFVDDTPRVEKLHAALRAIFATDPEIEVLGESDGFPFEPGDA